MDLIRSRRASKVKEATHENTLNEFCTQISELANIITGSTHSSDEFAKTAASVRVVEAFELLYRNPPKQLPALKTSLQVCALEINLAALRTVPEHKPRAENMAHRVQSQQLLGNYSSRS